MDPLGRHVFQVDDYYMSAAMLAAVGWVIAISEQVSSGLGQHQSTLTSDQILHFQQAAYSSHFLYVVSICLAKMAILHFLLTLARKDSRSLAVKVTIVFNIIFLVVAIFAIAFQCRLPQPWLTITGKCFNQNAFWIVFGLTDILVDLATVVLPFFLLHDLHLAWGKKFPAIIAFTLRAIVVPIIIVRLVFLSIHASSSDQTYEGFSTTIATSVHINLSVIVTCLPFLKSVFDSLQTGHLASDLRTLGSSPLSHRHALSYLKKPDRSAGVASPQATKQFRGRGEDTFSAVATVNSKAEGKPWEREGWRNLNGGSKERMVINHTTTMEVEYA
ncbi:MAG: hypothetical protein MMC33_001565 [Icmadophila ericetorum]|nr:hypothetical protein [Icmadophila ericetorum]